MGEQVGALCIASFMCRSEGALGRIRTCDTRFRKPMLYPLSYEGRGVRFYEARRIDTADPLSERHGPRKAQAAGGMLWLIRKRFSGS